MNPINEALRILGHFWLEEIRPNDIATIAALPELAETVSKVDRATIIDLAVEYQRLFGFNLPPYESVFIDPSAMLLAPATARVQGLYRQAGWTPPANVRIGAPDHLGLELLALAEIKQKPRLKHDPQIEQAALQLHTKHLALWAPALILTLRRLNPHPFYVVLGDLTLDLLLATLPANSPFRAEGPLQAMVDPFPTLPAPPVYIDDKKKSADFNQHSSIEIEPSSALRDVVKLLLTPCECGLFLTREDIARISRVLDLPAVMGERPYMLKTLFQLAGQYELIPALLKQLRQLLVQADAIYRGWAGNYPGWTPYAQAWCRRIAAAQVVLNELEELIS